MIYSDRQRLDKIVEMGIKLAAYLSDNQIDVAVVENRYAVQWAVTTPLYNIGEHTYNLSKELKEQYSDVPWAKISGLRHRLVHDYEGTNWSIICSVIFDELPPFIARLQDIRKTLE